jgi:hypothetical protein
MGDGVSVLTMGWGAGLVITLHLCVVSARIHVVPVHRYLAMALVSKGNMDDEGYVEALQRALAVQEQLLSKIRGACVACTFNLCAMHAHSIFVLHAHSIFVPCMAVHICL